MKNRLTEDELLHSHFSSLGFGGVLKRYCMIALCVDF